ncbi:hypothetical protein HPP92_024572 [Vanilla planifolia]|uniref:Uncharacterized protein n=1 Tax=Vanilla planifolia TaxID=51239 RepID=A0A835PMR0_VANPL|nr:hypothetical protein HPP92_024572 [Vanilla planifolia]
MTQFARCGLEHTDASLGVEVLVENLEEKKSNASNKKEKYWIPKGIKINQSAGSLTIWLEEDDLGIMQPFPKLHSNKDEHAECYLLLPTVMPLILSPAFQPESAL